MGGATPLLTLTHNPPQLRRKTQFIWEATPVSIHGPCPSTQLPVTFFNFASLSHSWGKAELPVNNLQVQRLSEECTAH